MALIIDGAGATGISSGATSVTATITTSLANDIIVAFIHYQQSTLGITASVSGGGLTWARRVQYTAVGSVSTNNVEEWWAAAASPLAAQTITATFTAAIDDCSLQLIAVNGAGSLTSPWDSNASLPATGLGNAGTASVSISTTTANTLVLGFHGSPTGVAAGAGSGFTSLYTTANGGGARWSFTLSEYQLFVTAQSGYPASFTGTSLTAGLIFDAIAATVVRPPVEFAGNLGGISHYGKLSYGKASYSRISAFAPVFAGDLSLAPVVYVDIAGNLAPVVSFSADLGKVMAFAGDLAPAVSFAADLDVHVNLIDLAGDLAPQIALGGSLSLDLPLTVLEGGLTPIVVLAASSFISGPLWADTEPCPSPPWAASDLCPPAPWMTSAPCDPVVWSKSRMCNG